MVCRICYPDEAKAYWVGKPQNPKPGQVVASYQRVPIKGVKREELSSYLTKNILPDEVCQKHIDEHILRKVEKMYGTLVKPELKTEEKKIVLQRENKPDEIVTFDELASLLF